MLFGINNVLEAGYEVHFAPAANHEFTMTVSRDGVMGKQGVTDSWIHGCIEKLVKLGEVEVVVDVSDLLVSLCKHHVRVSKDGDFYVVTWLEGLQAGQMTLSTDYATALLGACVSASELPKSESYKPREGYSGGRVRQQLDNGMKFELLNNPDPCEGGYMVIVWCGDNKVAEAGGYAHSAIQNALRACEEKHEPAPDA